jgi:hypothetical protein
MRRLVPWLLIALAVPRLVRILYPTVWVEDDLLLESAFAVAKGMRPYLDFAHAQMPLLEWVGGLYIRLAGAGHVRMEILNAAAAYATSVLIFVVGRRAIGVRGATAASLLYACHSLVFRYHVWARELFVSALVLGAIAALLADTLSWRVRFIVVPALLCAACAIKLTAVVAVVGICAFVAAGMRAPVRAAALALVTAAGLAAFVALCYRMYGEPFLFQAFLFHFLKGSDPAAGPRYIASLLDVLGPLSLVGLLYVADPRRWNTALGMMTTVLAAELLFFALLSPTAWGHNYLEAWPFVAIVAGAGVAWILEAWRTSWIKPLAATGAAAACLVYVTPMQNESSLRDSVYGFGFVPRQELSQLATALADTTGPSEEVIAPSFIAFEANRLQAVRYPENYGVMTFGYRSWRSDGFSGARARLAGKSFFDLIDETAGIWTAELTRAIDRGGRVNAVVPDSPIQLLPLVNAPPAALSARDFHLALQSAHFSLWIRRNDAITIK